MITVWHDCYFFLYLSYKNKAKHPCNENSLTQIAKVLAQKLDF